MGDARTARATDRPKAPPQLAVGSLGRLGFAAAVLALVAIPPRSQAQDCGASATQADLNACAAARLKAADDALNAVYRAVTGRLADDQPTRQQLVTAQRAWLAFRDAECGFRTSAAAGGSIQPMLVADCSTDLTRKRVAELTALLDCEEGDVACSVPRR